MVVSFILTRRPRLDERKRGANLARQLAPWASRATPELRSRKQL
jgi:hypothetical protein